MHLTTHLTREHQESFWSAWKVALMRVSCFVHVMLINFGWSFFSDWSQFWILAAWM